MTLPRKLRTPTASTSTVAQPAPTQPVVTGTQPAATNAGSVQLVPSVGFFTDEPIDLTGAHVFFSKKRKI